MLIEIRTKHIQALLIALVISIASIGQVSFGSPEINTDHTGIVNSVAFDEYEKKYYSAGKTDSGSWSIICLDFDGNSLWKMRDLNNAGSEISEIALDSKGNIYVVGYFFDTMHLPQNIDGTSYREFLAKGGTDAFIASYTPEGSLRWAKQYGNTNQDIAMSLILVDNQIYTTMLIQGDGSILPVIGFLSSTDSRLIVGKLSLEGDMVDLMHFASSNNFIDLPDKSAVSNVLQKIKVDITYHDEDLYIVGPFNNDITPLNSGSSAIGPTTNTVVTNAPGIFLSKLGLDLSHVWTTRVESNRTEAIFNGLSVTADCNGVFVGGGLDSNPGGFGKTLRYFNPNITSGFNFHKTTLC